jgi:hypothetical protein
MTSQEIFPSCWLMEVYVSLCCTITKQTLYRWNPSRMLTTAAFLQHIRRYLRPWRKRGTNQRWTWWTMLELSRTGTYEEYLYREFHGYRARVLLLVLRFIGIIMRTRTHQCVRVRTRQRITHIPVTHR